MIILTTKSIKKLRNEDIDFKKFYFWLINNRRKIVSGIRYLIPEEDSFFDMFRTPNVNITKLILTYKKYVEKKIL